MTVAGWLEERGVESESAWIGSIAGGGRLLVASCQCGKRCATQMPNKAFVSCQISIAITATAASMISMVT